MSRPLQYACPACGSMDTASALAFSAIPVFLFPVPSTVSKTVECRDVHLNRCSHCSHGFQADIDTAVLKLIYEDYYQYYPLIESETFKRPYREPFNDLFDLISSNLQSGSRLLDIGCASPSQLIPFRDRGFECTGIDPNPIAQEQPGLTIVQGYYEEHLFDSPFDVVISRFNLEHIVSLDKYVDRTLRNLSRDGIVVVQVPNLAYYLANRIPMFGAYEHIHYFTLSSLSALFGRHGLQPICFLEAGRPSIVAAFSRGCSAAADVRFLPRDLWTSYLQERQATDQQFRSLIKSFARPQLYGAGINVFWALPILDSVGRKPTAIFDDNVALEGLALPAYDLSICRAQEAAFSDADVVVLTLNPMYHDSVANRLRAWRPELPIIRLDSNGVHLST
jgi:SAM-dependent methyltransferase